MEEGRSASKMLTGKYTGKRHLGRPRQRWDDNIKNESIREIGLIQLVVGIIGELLRIELSLNLQVP
jgi:hypothetical protein